MFNSLYFTKERERDTKGPSITSFRTNTFALKNYLFISSRGERERERESETRITLLRGGGRGRGGGVVSRFCSSRARERARF